MTYTIQLSGCIAKFNKEIVVGSAARDPHGIKQITVGPPHGIKQITMFIRENVECLDSSFTTTTTIKAAISNPVPELVQSSRMRTKAPQEGSLVTGLYLPGLLHWVQQKPMCHLHLDNLIYVHERHITPYVQLFENKGISTRCDPFPLPALTGEAGTELTSPSSKAA
ncbi:hypothetical protein J6590_068856 [Homalodisca vitripennis]|nr:hypothetical protein J6590_068856 [Homalodisca vitripennis]